MCLGVPMKIIQKKDNETAVVDMGKSKLEICTALTPEAKEGDYVIVHAGFSISILSEKEAEFLLESIRREVQINE
ncbi:MAG: HypC/HybG/HupF family hydrogenase formation chaperone [Candidatus Calescibacterium sp.]|nr:HypC/HybG/HupF family hydrogenase formation chaperone [Candidatus Calescibacterium sp.]MCX7734045.1 HypC/HybG/HupF family hydrogenase formation chaperone [bacterium]MDW8087040.1 HypC/HybG/HupF family hydrogenase formation chaperone [Candidatus Calescibacterium sp.]